MDILVRVGTITVVFGVAFFLFCAGLVFWYLFNQPKPAATAPDTESPVEVTSVHGDGLGSDG
jgi:hypothetical protein